MPSRSGTKTGSSQDPRSPCVRTRRICMRSRVICVCGIVPLSVSVSVLASAYYRWCLQAQGCALGGGLGANSAHVRLFVGRPLTVVGAGLRASLRSKHTHTQLIPAHVLLSQLGTCTVNSNTRTFNCGSALARHVYN